MDLNKMLNPEEPSQAQSPQLLQPGQASDNNGSHNLPGIHSLSLLGAFHHEGSSLPTSTGDASTQGATSVKGAQNESSALSSTNQDLNVSLFHPPPYDYQHHLTTSGLKHLVLDASTSTS